jgi:hypothetical protein
VSNGANTCLVSPQCLRRGRAGLAFPRQCREEPRRESVRHRHQSELMGHLLGVFGKEKGGEIAVIDVV